MIFDRSRQQGYRGCSSARVIARYGLCFAFAMLAGLIQSANAQTFTVLNEFDGAHGANPWAGVIKDASGTLYGTTSGGGGLGYGTVFKFNKAEGETVLVGFNISNGAFPGSNLIMDSAHNLYGTALEGPGGAGVLFKVSKTGKESIVYAFQGGTGSKAAVPSGGVITDGAGNFYGATLRGGLGVGVIYRISPDGKLTVLYKFHDKSDGGVPEGPLVQDKEGNLYGVANSGGAQQDGVLFRLAKNGKLTVLHAFTTSEGSNVQGGLVMDSSGNLFGSALGGGESGNGTVFELENNGRFKVLHNFTGGADGAQPNGQLILDAKGNIYGTAETGGVDSFYGTVFKLRVSGHLTVLYGFTGGEDGATPIGGLFRDSAGNLYGTTDQNFLFSQRDGTLFEIAF